MNKYLVALLIVYLCSNVNGIKLENLCEKFDYKGLEVNSFFQVKWNFTVRRVSTYAIEENYNFAKILNKTEAETASKIRDELNALVVDLYSEAYINSEKLKTIEKEKETILKLRNQMNSTLENIKRFYQHERENLLSKFDNTIKLIDTFLHFRQNRVNKCRDSRFYQFDLGHVLRNLKIEKNQTFVLRNESIESIHKQPIQQLERFVFIRASEMYYNFDSYGIIEYSINLPFNNENYQSKPCTSVKTLPPFFNQKN